MVAELPLNAGVAKLQLPDEISPDEMADVKEWITIVLRPHERRAAQVEALMPKQAAPSGSE